MVCTAISCPCAETAQSCPQDCAKENGQINQVSITDILSNPDQYLDKRVQLEEKFCGWGQTTGSASPLFSRSDWCICQNPQKKAEQSLTVTGAALPVGVSPSESESIGEILSITGVVKKTSNNIPYIEAEKIVSEICEINKEYESTAVNSIKCQCPEGYKFQIISMGWGPCPEPGMSDCPASKQKCVPITTTEESCQTDSDCACGVKIDTRECFFGNKNYVDTKTQCPDFCTGIDGKIETKCVNNLCQQVHQ